MFVYALLNMHQKKWEKKISPIEWFEAIFCGVFDQKTESNWFPSLQSKEKSKYHLYPIKTYFF